MRSVAELHEYSTQMQIVLTVRFLECLGYRGRLVILMLGISSGISKFVDCAALVSDFHIQARGYWALLGSIDRSLTQASVSFQRPCYRHSNYVRRQCSGTLHVFVGRVVSYGDERTAH